MAILKSANKSLKVVTQFLITGDCLDVISVPFTHLHLSDSLRYFSENAVDLILIFFSDKIIRHVSPVK